MLAILPFIIQLLSAAVPGVTAAVSSRRSNPTTAILMQVLQDFPAAATLYHQILSALSPVDLATLIAEVAAGAKELDAIDDKLQADAARVV